MRLSHEINDLVCPTLSNGGIENKRGFSPLSNLSVPGDAPGNTACHGRIAVFCHEIESSGRSRQGHGPTVRRGIPVAVEKWREAWPSRASRNSRLCSVKLPRCLFSDEPCILVPYDNYRRPNPIDEDVPVREAAQSGLVSALGSCWVARKGTKYAGDYFLISIPLTRDL